MPGQAHWRHTCATHSPHLVYALTHRRPHPPFTRPPHTPSSSRQLHGVTGHIEWFPPTIALREGFRMTYVEHPHRGWTKHGGSVGSTFTYCCGAYVLSERAYVRAKNIIHPPPPPPPGTPRTQRDGTRAGRRQMVSARRRCCFTPSRLTRVRASARSGGARAATSGEWKGGRWKTSRRARGRARGIFIYSRIARILGVSIVCSVTVVRSGRGVECIRAGTRSLHVQLAN